MTKGIIFLQMAVSGNPVFKLYKPIIQKAKYMFAKEQIEAASAKVKNGPDYPKLILDFKTLGIKHYEHIVAGGSTIYYGDNNHFVRIDHQQPGKKKISTDKPYSKSVLIKQLVIQAVWLLHWGLFAWL